MSIHIHKSHNVNLMMYHIVCPAKYRRVVLTEPVDRTIKAACLEIALRYEIHFLEIGSDADHMHFLIQSVPTMLPQSVVQIIKSITAREVFEKNPEVKKQLWGGQFWSKGYYINTVGRNHSENAVREYVRSQGRDREYKEILKQQHTLFDH